MKHKIIKTLTAVMLAAACFSTMYVSGNAAKEETAVGQTQLAQNQIQGSAILHCFCWSYNNIKAKLPEIAQAGYTAVQTSPVQQPKNYNANYTDTSGQWWKLYQPLAISVSDGNNWLGTRAELKSLCDEAENYNIKVIVDIVANHMANKSDGGGYSNLSSDVEADMKNPDYFHTETYGASDDSRYSMTHGHIGMPDLNTGNSHVQERFLGLLKQCVDLGVDGFRFDAAKHIETPGDDAETRSDFWSYIINGIKEYRSDVYCYGEILNSAGTSITNYTAYMDVTDNLTGNDALAGANSQNAGKLAASSYQMGAGPSRSILWAESHDTYMDGSTSGISDSSILKAWAITGARAGSTSLFLARPNNRMGAASTNDSWKSPVVAEVNKFKNYFADESEYMSCSGNTAYIERGASGVSISKLDGGGNVSLDAHTMLAGTYTDQISGNTFTVSNGKISGTVGSSGIAVVYNLPQDVEETTAAPTTIAPTTVAPTTVAPTTIAPTTTAQTDSGVTLTMLVGDVDEDGFISIKDTTAIQKQLAGLADYPNISYNGDCDESGNLTISDATKIQYYLCSLINYGSVGQNKQFTIQGSSDAYTVFLTDSQNWGNNINCYFWSQYNNNMTSWPGEKMIFSGRNGMNQRVYRLTVPKSVTYVIFSGNGNQTVDIPLNSSKLKFYIESTTDSNGKYLYGNW